MSVSRGYDPEPPRPIAVTVDVALFDVSNDRPCVVLVERGNDPYKGSLALPGGFVEPDEDLPEAAARELAEETGLVSPAPLIQLGAYGTPGRDPRMRTVSIVFWALADELAEPEGGTDAAKATLIPVEDALADPERLAFDHHQILGDAWREAKTTLECP